MNPLHLLEQDYYRNAVFFGGRVTRHKDVPIVMHDLFNHFKQYSPLVLIGEEKVDTPGHHVHVVVCVKKLMDENPKIKTERHLKDWFAEKVRELYPTLEGNAHLGGSYAKAKKRLCIYATKGGLFLYHGFSKDFVETMFKLSSDNDESLYKSLRNNLEELFVLKKITLLQFKVEILKLYPRFGKNIYLHHLKAYFNRIELGRSPSDELCVQFLEKNNI